MPKLAFVLGCCLFLLIDFPISLPSAINGQETVTGNELAIKPGIPRRRLGGGTRLAPVLEVAYG